MAHPTTLYRFRIDLSDVDRGVYQTLDLRVAQHPSETPAYLLSRILAYALSYEEGLEFSPGGLSDTEAPALTVRDLTGGLRVWIEIGNPNPRKLHKAAKAADIVKVFTYKDPENLLREMSSNQVHRAEEIEIYSFEPRFLDRLAVHLEKDNKWSVIQTEGSLSITVRDEVEQGEVQSHRAKRN
jgi:uncharacterized protein YaeQ